MLSKSSAIIAWLCLGTCACGRTSLRGGADEGPEEDFGPETCMPGPPCTLPRVDAETGRCTRVLAPSGTACRAPCNPYGTCVEGYCARTGPDGCDDGNACTVDACSEELGCSHEDLACPGTTDFCQVTECDPLLGCITAPGPDGTPCSTGTCGASNTCRSGECVPGDVSPPRLVARWNFDETAGTAVLDSSGRGHHGVLVAGTRASAPRTGGLANVGQGLLVDVPDHSDVAFSGSFTVQAWVQTGPTTPVGQEVIVFRGDAREGLDPFILSLQPTGMVQFVVTGPEDGTSAVAMTPIPPGEPLQLTAVFDAVTREVELYLQCVLADATCTGFGHAMRDLDASSTPGVGLGSHAGRGGTIYAFRGVLDEVRLYDGVLSPDEIQSSCDP